MNLSASEKLIRTKRLHEFMERYRRELALRPEVTDEEFMAETEVSDEQYNLGLVLPSEPTD